MKNAFLSFDEKPILQQAPDGRGARVPGGKKKKKCVIQVDLYELIDHISQ